MMKSTAYWADRALARATETVAIALFLLIPILTAYQVVARFILQQPSPWSEAAIQMSMIWSTLLGFSILLRQGALLSMDFIEKRVPARFLNLLSFVHFAAAMALLLVMLFAGLKLIGIVKTQRLAGLGISMAYAYGAVPAGAVISMLTLMCRTALVLATRRDHGDPPKLPFWADIMAKGNAAPRQEGV
jgi:TRAP-type C4-dicarboxylate transport system permease small subunit